MGIKGIQYIFQDRLGLTNTRVPAVFPHPMFFFTFIYKLLILSLFNTVIMTLLSTFVCNWADPYRPYSTILSVPPLQCFGGEHSMYSLFSLIAISVYYPLSAYTMPNFQFSEKSLDLKYQPSYLIIYFQVNFLLATGKVLLSQATSQSHIVTLEVVFQCCNIGGLGVLMFMVIYLKPCMIRWVNYVDFGILWVSFIWNLFGLVLYFTNYHLLCVILSAAISVFSILALIFIVKKIYFSPKVHDEAGLD